MLVVLLIACSGKKPADEKCTVQISVRSKQEKDYWINARTMCPGGDSLVSTWPLPYPVYHFECADIDGDGIIDIAVGVEKATRFDTLVRKRLFLFKLVDGYIRPLWLGSRLPQPLVGFTLDRETVPALVRTIEQEQDGSFLVAEYRWKGFGLGFIRYIGRELTGEKAGMLLHMKNLPD